jgi:hypothetical protein
VVIDAVRIYESLILCCGGAEIRATRSEERPPGRIDALLPSLIRDLLTRLQQTEQRMLKCALLDTLLECFLYSVPLTLAALDAAGATDALLRALLECDIDKFFMRMHDKKMVAMGLTALLFSTPLAALPDTVRQLAPVLLAYTLRVIDALQSQSVELTNEEAKRAEMLESLRQNHPQLTEDELRELASEMHFNQEFGDMPEGQFDDDEDDDRGRRGRGAGLWQRVWRHCRQHGQHRAARRQGGGGARRRFRRYRRARRYGPRGGALVHVSARSDPGVCTLSHALRGGERARAGSCSSKLSAPCCPTTAH